MRALAFPPESLAVPTENAGFAHPGLHQTTIAMKTTILLPAAALATANLATAAIGIVEATGQFSVNGSTTYISSIGAPSNARLDGYDFGTFNPTVGDTLTLANWYFENYAWNGGDTPPGGGTNNNWLDDANTATLNLVIAGNDHTQTLTQSGVSGNNRFWNNSPDTVDILAGLPNGTYTITASVSYTFNEWTGVKNVLTSSNNGPSTASFTVIPEPASAALGLLGATLLLRRRRN